MENEVKKYTKKIIQFLIIAAVCGIAAPVLIYCAEWYVYDDTLQTIMAFIAFLAIGAVFVLIFIIIVFVRMRSYAKRKIPSEEAKSELAPDKAWAQGINEKAGLPQCPSCGTFNKRGAERCEFCGADMEATTAEPGKSRLSDEELSKKIGTASMMTMIYLFLGLASMVCILVFADYSGDTAPPLMIVSIVAVFVFIFLCIQSSLKSKKLISVNVIQDILAEVIDELVYKPDESITRERVHDAGLIYGWNRFQGTDYSCGKYRGHDIELSDLHLSYEGSGSGDNDRNRDASRTVFQGQWLTCKLGKTIPATVRVREKLVDTDAGSEVQTENAAFNAKYQILADDPHYAFYILTPHFMEHIMAADEKADARTFFCFSGDCVHIAIHNNHGLFQLILNDKKEKRNISLLRARFRSELKYVTDILDELLKNEYLFSE